jgi:hypothetical protein
MKPIKTMYGVAAALAATALGGWTYAAPSPCETHMAELEASYARHSGTFGHGEMMSGLHAAESYCEAGEAKLAATLLNHLAQTCRAEGGCA